MDTTANTFGVVDELVDGYLARLGGTISVWYGGLDGAPGYARAADVTHYAASTMKLPLLVAAYRLHERGALSLDAEVFVHNEFASALDGSRFSMAPDHDQDDETWALLGSTATLRRLALHAIVKSGNLATNLLLSHVGTDEVSAVLGDAGCSGATVLPRGIEDATAREAGIDNLVTAADLARVMLGVANRTLAQEQTCRDIEEVVARQEHVDKIPAGLPPGTYVANKTGWVDAVAHDVALVRPDGEAPYVLAVCTSIDLSEHDGSALVAAISSAVWKGRHA